MLVTVFAILVTNIHYLLTMVPYTYYGTYHTLHDTIGKRPIYQISMSSIAILTHCFEYTQIEERNLVYQNHVAKSWKKLEIGQKIDLKFLHHPRNPTNFWNFFLIFLIINNYDPWGSFFIVCRHSRPFLINLVPNDWLKIKKNDFVQKFSTKFLTTRWRQIEILMVGGSYLSQGQWGT